MPRARSPQRAAAAREILERLRRAIPDADIALDFADPLQLVVATILAAQCTDARVNIVTKDLFRRYKATSDFAAADPSELERAIHSTGFFRAKAKSIRGMAAALLERHAGEVPRTMEELTALPGVGRKTANVVLGNAFGIPGIIVDTHFLRVTHRLGLTKHADPEKVEADLAALVPREAWTEFSHLITHHGRRTCDARKPKCDACALAELCPEGARRARGRAAASR